MHGILVKPELNPDEVFLLRFLRENFGTLLALLQIAKN